MRWSGRIAVVLVALVILSTSGATAANGMAGPEPRVDASSVRDITTVRVTQAFAALPEPGIVRASYHFDIPENIEQLSTRVPPDATAISTSGGFEHAGGDRYTWEGGAGTPSITFRWPVNDTTTVSGPEGAGGRYRFADVGDWGLFARPPVPIDVSYYGDGVRFDRETAVDGDGVAGRWLVFVGEAAVHRRTAANQEFTLVKPAAADLAARPSEILAVLGDAAGALQVGSRDEEVLAVAAPTSVDWAVEGLAVGAGDFYVTADEPLDAAENTWLHEYVHTRQSFNLTRETRWLTEATATYYAALLALEQDRVDFDAFRDVLATGTWDRFGDVVLTEPSTWTAGANYRKGGLAIGEIDRRLRLATDQRRSFQTVFETLNHRSEPIDAEAFVDLVARVGSQDVGDAADRFTLTSATPTVWDRDAHAAAFGQLPARLSFDIGERFRVLGPYRNRSIGGDPLVVVPGERLVANLTVTNVGGTAGRYDLLYGLVGSELRSVNGTVAAGETVVERLALEPDRVDEVTFRVGEFTRAVSVLEPATPSIASLSANRSRIQAGTAVELAVEIRNGEPHPGRRTVTVTADGRTVTNRTVYLEGSETRTLTVVVRPAMVGTVGFTAGGRSVDLRVIATSPEPRSADPRSESRKTTRGGSGPGIGPVGAVVALLLALGAGRFDNS